MIGDMQSQFFQFFSHPRFFWTGKLYLGQKIIDVSDMQSQFFQFFAHRTNFLKINQTINNALGKRI